MDAIKQQLSKSVMNYITLSLISIMGVALLSIFISFWFTDLADRDAHAMNLSGSMRMQTYRLGLALQQDDIASANTYTEQLNQTWNHSLFFAQRNTDDVDELSQKFTRAYQHWIQILQPKLRASFKDPKILFDYALLKTQVSLTDEVVQQFQQDAESKIRSLRSFQLLALLITTLVGSLIFTLLKNRIERPLNQLTQAAHKLGQGDYNQRVKVDGEDELNLLGEVFNQMSESIENSHNQLEKRVQDRTAELNQNNITLEFLFNVARKIIDTHSGSLDYQDVIDDLAKVLGLGSLDLCLFTTNGEKPYMHIAPTEEHARDCSQRSCEACKSEVPASPLNIVNISDRYAISREARNYGVINLNLQAGKVLERWQKKLLISVADQMAISLSLEERKDQERRLAMLSERTVMARELHDSLAQALSYLQIQVTRLQKSRDKQRWELQQPIIDELREGLSSAYRQLRELLTTFRLKMDKDGLRGALENTVLQLQERSKMQIELDYLLDDLPLSPTEEIHLLQIVREASQNAIHHSKGSRVDIKLTQREDTKISLTITDDGVGIKNSPEKLNHYGLAIMNERSRHLGGSIKISARPEGGTQVEFEFAPTFRGETLSTHP